ncbi:MAG: hypothetical protein WD929_00490 [Steroidobacteraceae bacterium]
MFISSGVCFDPGVMFCLCAAALCHRPDTSAEMPAGRGIMASIHRTDGKPWRTE